MLLVTFKRSKKNLKLFELVDRLNECNEELNYHAIRRTSNRLNRIENNAVEIEKIAKEIQEVVKAMRRK